MNFLALLNLALALNTLNEAKNTVFFTGFHFEQTEAADGVVTFEPAVARFQGQVKLVVVVDESGNIEKTRLLMKRSFIAGAQSPQAREIAKSFLKHMLTAEDLARIDPLVKEISLARFTTIHSAGYQTFLGKQSHFETRFASGTLLEMDEDSGWLVIFAGRSDGPRIGLSFTSYNLKGMPKKAN